MTKLYPIVERKLFLLMSRNVARLIKSIYTLTDSFDNLQQMRDMGAKTVIDSCINPVNNDNRLPLSSLAWNNFHAEHEMSGGTPVNAYKLHNQETAAL